ncbi:MAG: APH(3') family aminoglycoside O-phosphotransferase [Planctomycetota bacterium]
MSPTSKFPSHVPDSIRTQLGVGEGRLFVGNCSGASVFDVESPDVGRCFLKVQHETPAVSLEDEVRRLRWLAGKLPVPEVVAFEQHQNGAGPCGYLVTRAVHGKPTHELIRDEPFKVAKQMAEAARLLHELPLDDCPFDETLERRLAIAERNVANNRIDAKQLSKDEKPADRLKRLTKKQPEEDLVFTHGDLALPNVLVDFNGLAGVLDVGLAGIADRHRDLALVVKSLRYNLAHIGAGVWAQYRTVETFYQWYGKDRVNKKKLKFYADLDELC